MNLTEGNNLKAELLSKSGSIRSEGDGAVFMPSLHIQNESFQNNSRFNQSLPEETQKNLNRYKKYLLYTIIIVMVFLGLIIAERVASHQLISQETDLLISFQESQYIGIDMYGPLNYFYYIIGLVGEFHFFFLLETHLLITIYVAVDAFIALKTLFLHVFFCYFFSLLSTFYATPRPFWIDSQIRSYFCEQTFSLPGEFFFSVVFLLSYLYKCFKEMQEEIVLTLTERDSVASSSGASLDHLNTQKGIRLLRIFFLVLLMLACVVFFFRYAQGLCYIHAYAIGFVYFIIVCGLVFFFDSYLQDLIKQTTIMKNYAKQKIFSWFLGLILLEALAILVYFYFDTSKIKRTWIENFVNFLIFEVSIKKFLVDLSGEKFRTNR